MAHNPSTTSSLGENIRSLRRACGLSQEELANRLGVSRQAVSLWEQDSTQPSLDNLRIMASVLKTDFNALLGSIPASDTSNDQAPLPDVPPAQPSNPDPPRLTQSPRNDSPEAVQRRMLERKIDRCTSLAILFFLTPFFLICAVLLVVAISQTFDFSVSDNAGGLMVLLTMVGSVAAIALGIQQCIRKSRARKNLMILPADTEVCPHRPSGKDPDRASPSAPSVSIPHRGRTVEQFLLLLAYGFSALSIVSTLFFIIGSMRGSFASFVFPLTGSVALITAYVCLLACRLILAWRDKRAGYPISRLFLPWTGASRRRRFAAVLSILSITLFVTSCILRISAMRGNGGLPCIIAAGICFMLADLILLVGVTLHRQNP